MDMLATGVSAQQRQRRLDFADTIRALATQNQGEFKKGISLQTLREMIARKECLSDYNKIDEKDLLAAVTMLAEQNELLTIGN